MPNIRKDLINDTMTRSERVNFVKNTVKENKICSRIGQVLIKHYPGWTWGIDCKIETGVVTIKCLNLHGDYGFLLYIDQVDQAAGEHAAVTAAGELLERCNIPRGKKPEDLVLDQDKRGNVKDIDLHMSGRS